jgi:hypothetical protein
MHELGHARDSISHSCTQVSIFHLLRLSFDSHSKQQMVRRVREVRIHPAKGEWSSLNINKKQKRFNHKSQLYFLVHDRIPAPRDRKRTAATERQMGTVWYMVYGMVRQRGMRARVGV